ncbi:dolichol-phosphate mannosyltransferase [Candidatus Nitrosopumilus koreensis AR1]|uniref:Dolichol-phosphate mannosyltransferase n=1 Tax=Candidatus Nitrosopumilus koreensis AR1 TaxID=1229908 RepID=K0B4L3_9ARCH|nr:MULTISPECIES: glycosyltransferase family 2 protein [Nitrosopumilus]AFS81113.1 dolichol-phosphate mannosyltransferase [Candidatus Nitrosopumilus koreensis AR1]
MQSTEVSIILPTYNESQNISEILEHIQKSVPENLRAETIVVDDNSPDNTAKIAEDYFHSIAEKTHHTINVIKRKARDGLSSAILSGIEHASGHTIVVMDSDFSHPPHVIPKLIDTIKQTKCDIAIASRYVKGGSIQGWPFKRKLMSKIATGIAKKGLGIELYDPMSGFFAFKKNIIDGLKFDAIGYKMLLELLVKTKGVKIQEVPYTFTDRKDGSSKLGAGTILDYCKSVWKLYRYGKTVTKSEKRISVRFFSKAARFFTVGALGLGVNYLASLLFSSSLDMWYLHATILGIAFSITSNFALNKYWTFEDRDFAPKRTIIQYGKFAGFSSIGALVQLGTVYYLVDEFSLSYPVALVLAVGTAAFSNFVLNKKWTFKEKVWS